MERAEADIRSILSTIYRQAALIFGVVILTLCIATAHILTSGPLYSATALVLFDQTNKNLLEPDTPAPLPPTDRSRIDSEVELMQSDAVLLAVIRSEELTNDPEFRPEPDQNLTEDAAAQLTLEKLKHAISVERRGTTLVLAITARSSSATRSAELANQVAHHYIALQVSQKVQNLLDYRALLGEHLTAARESLEAAVASYDGFIDNNIDLLISESALPELMIANEALHRQGSLLLAKQLREQLHYDLISSKLSSDLALKLYEYQQSEDLAHAQYDAILARYQSLTTQTNLQVPDSRIVSSAQTPTRPSSPNIPTTLGLASLFGGCLGIISALLFENLIGGFLSKEQIEATLRVANSATLPRGKPRTEKDSLSELIIDRPHCPFSEAIRRLRATIGFALPDPPRHEDLGTLIVVTSSTAEEGKSTTAVSLARCYALSGKKTLLIDGDLRAPTVHHHLTIAPSLKLIEALSDRTNPIAAPSLANADPLTPLSVITGTRQTNSASGELLNTRTFDALLDSARRNYEIVILDTPPVSLFTDALYVAPLADVVLLVTKWATTSQREVKQTVQALRHASGFEWPILPVLSQVKDNPSFMKRKRTNYYAQPAQ